MDTMRALVFRGPNEVGERVLVGAITPCGAHRRIASHVVTHAPCSVLVVKGSD